MSQTLLAVVGVVVFFITLSATLIYGYYFLDQLQQADASPRSGVDGARATSASDVTPHLPEAAPTSPLSK